MEDQTNYRNDLSRLCNFIAEKFDTRLDADGSLQTAKIDDLPLPESLETIDESFYSTLLSKNKIISDFKQQGMGRKRAEVIYRAFLGQNKESEEVIDHKCKSDMIEIYGSEIKFDLEGRDFS